MISDDAWQTLHVSNIWRYSLPELTCFMEGKSDLTVIWHQREILAPNRRKMFLEKSMCSVLFYFSLSNIIINIGLFNLRVGKIHKDWLLEYFS